MKENLQENSKFWDILLLRKDGGWSGFRVPWPALQRVATTLVVVFVLASITLSAWVWTRYRLLKLDEERALLVLENLALKAQVRDLSRSPMDSGMSGSFRIPHSSLPNMDSSLTQSEWLQVDNVSNTFAHQGQQWTFQFTLNPSSRPMSAGNTLYWIALLHGPQGILSFPSAMVSRSGELLQFEQGQPIDIPLRPRQVSARFKIGDFIERAPADPVYTTLLIYDSKGSLILRQRYPLSVSR